jgi:hypothetical protein
MASYKIVLRLTRLSDGRSADLKSIIDRGIMETVYASGRTGLGVTLDSAKASSRGGRVTLMVDVIGGRLTRSEAALVVDRTLLRGLTHKYDAEILDVRMMMAASRVRRTKTYVYEDRDWCCDDKDWYSKYCC